MEILEIRPEPGGGNVVARFDAQLTPFIRMVGLKLVRSPRGYRVYAPNTNGSNIASFAPSFAELITNAALRALDGVAETHGANPKIAA